MSAWVVSHLDMADARQGFVHRGGQLAYRALGMVDVILNKGVVGARFHQNRNSLGGAVWIEARNIEGVDPLYQQLEVTAKGATPASPPAPSP